MTTVDYLALADDLEAAAAKTLAAAREVRQLAERMRPGCLKPVVGWGEVEGSVREALAQAKRVGGSA